MPIKVIGFRLPKHAVTKGLLGLAYSLQVYVYSPTSSKKSNSAFTHWRQCASVHFLSAICDHKQREGCGRWIVGYCC